MSVDKYSELDFKETVACQVCEKEFVCANNLNYESKICETCAKAHSSDGHLQYPIRPEKTNTRAEAWGLAALRTATLSDQFTLCRVESHDEELDRICTRCASKICSKCVTSGLHLGHRLEPVKIDIIDPHKINFLRNQLHKIRNDFESRMEDIGLNKRIVAIDIKQQEGFMLSIASVKAKELLLSSEEYAREQMLEIEKYIDEIKQTFDRVDLYMEQAEICSNNRERDETRKRIAGDLQSLISKSREIFNDKLRLQYFEPSSLASSYVENFMGEIMTFGQSNKQMNYRNMFLKEIFKGRSQYKYIQAFKITSKIAYIQK